jgi:hypothetical protein
MPGETDLSTLLRGIDPVLDPEEYVFALERGTSVDSAIGRFQEQEGTTVILPRERAERLGLVWSYPCRRITLRIHSSLEAIGLLARVSDALARSAISLNVVSAYYHDHLFVPAAQADETIRLLRALSAGQP